MCRHSCSKCIELKKGEIWKSFHFCVRELHTTGLLLLLYLIDTFWGSPLSLPNNHWQRCPVLLYSLLFSVHLSLWVSRWWWTAWPRGQAGESVYRLHLFTQSIIQLPCKLSGHIYFHCFCFFLPWLWYTFQKDCTQSLVDVGENAPARKITTITTNRASNSVKKKKKKQPSDHLHIFSERIQRGWKKIHSQDTAINVQ